MSEDNKLPQKARFHLTYSVDYISEKNTYLFSVRNAESLYQSVTTQMAIIELERDKIVIGFPSREYILPLVPGALMSQFVKGSNFFLSITGKDRQELGGLTLNIKQFPSFSEEELDNETVEITTAHEILKKFRKP